MFFACLGFFMRRLPREDLERVAAPKAKRLGGGLVAFDDRLEAYPTCSG